MGVTVTLATSCVATGAAIKLRLPVPEAAKPMAGLALVQVKEVAPVPEKGMLTAWPPQTVRSGTGLMSGAGRMVMGKVCPKP